MVSGLFKKWFCGLVMAVLAGWVPQTAKAYQADCAILLCLAGGWPASTECAHARAVFIRRITPWPIEPPLQIWRCPMGVSERAPLQSTAPKIWEASNHMPVRAVTALFLSRRDRQPCASLRPERGSKRDWAWEIDPANQPHHAADTGRTSGKMWCGECPAWPVSDALTGGFLPPAE